MLYLPEAYPHLVKNQTFQNCPSQGTLCAQGTDRLQSGLSPRAFNRLNRQGSDVAKLPTRGSRALASLFHVL